jgi:HEAT repeat protein
MGRTLPLLVLLLGSTVAAAQDPVIDSFMDADPQLPYPKIERAFSPKLLPLWLQSLDRPEADFRCQAALAIAKAQGRGMMGLSVAVAPLLREFKKPGQHTSVRLAAAKALVALDARDAAADLHAASIDDLDLREIVEPALTKWDYKPARELWLARLDQPPFGRGEVLAMQALTIVKETKAIDRLHAMVFDRHMPLAIRLEAARACGVLRTTGSEPDSERLAADPGPKGIGNRLAAASLLRHHSGDAAVKQLLSLAIDKEPSVAAVALARLVEIDPGLVVPILESVLASPDATVRSFGVMTLLARPSDAHIRKLGDRLLDPDPANRVRSREALKQLAGKPEWREMVIREGTRLLAGTDWRGQEQGALLTGQLEHKPAAERVSKLLTSDRPEVVIATGWTLRRLAVPETLPVVLEYMQMEYRRMLADKTGVGRRGITPDELDQQTSQLVQFLGMAKYRPASELFRRFIPPYLGPLNPGGIPPPPNPIGAETRVAAFWAFGKIHEGETVPDLSRAVLARLNAVGPPDGEAVRVRRMAAISLARMKDTGALPSLRLYFAEKKPNLDVVNNACGWGIEQLTGERVPPAGIIEWHYIDWFLFPFERKE